MSPTIAALPAIRKANDEQTPSSARALREALAAHSVSYEVVGRRWGNCKSRVATVLHGLMERIDALPATVRADWHRRCLAQLEAKPVRSLEGEHLDVVVELGRVSELLREAMADGSIDDAERARIRNAVAKLAGEVADCQRAVGL